MNENRIGQKKNLFLIVLKLIRIVLLFGERHFDDPAAPNESAQNALLTVRRAGRSARSGAQPAIL